MLGTMVVIGLGAPMVLLVFIPLGYVYRLVMRYYLATSRELKRLDAVSRSPIFSFFGETLAGLPVIRVRTPCRCHLLLRADHHRVSDRPGDSLQTPKHVSTEIKLATCPP